MSYLGEALNSMKDIRLTDGIECFTCTMVTIDELGPAEAMDNTGARYYRDDYDDTWTNDAVESLIMIHDGEGDEEAMNRLLAKKVTL